MNDTFSIIRDRIPIAEVLAYYGVQSRGGRYQCPIHGGDGYNAQITKHNTLHCFSQCGKSFDAVNIVEHFERCSKWQAIKILDTHYNLGLSKPLTEQERRDQELRRQEREQEKATEALRKKEICRQLDQLAHEIDTLECAIYELDALMEVLDAKIKSYGRSASNMLPNAPCDLLDTFVSYAKRRDECKQQRDKLIETEFWKTKVYNSDKVGSDIVSIPVQEDTIIIYNNILPARVEQTKPITSVNTKLTAFFDAYEKHTGRKHPEITATKLAKIMPHLDFCITPYGKRFDISDEEYHPLIDYYFGVFIPKMHGNAKGKDPLIFNFLTVLEKCHWAAVRHYARGNG